MFLLQNRNCLNSKSRVISECEANHSRKTYRVTTLLHYAAQHGHANIVRLLVKHGPDIGAETSLRSRCLEEMGARKNGASVFIVP